MTEDQKIKLKEMLNNIFINMNSMLVLKTGVVHVTFTDAEMNPDILISATVMKDGEMVQKHFE